MLVLGWVTAWEYMVLQAFFDLRLFLQTPAKNSIIILDILSIKKIWPRGGTRTGYLCVGRLTPYPLGHTDIKFGSIFLAKDFFADTCKKIYRHSCHFQLA